MDAVAQPIEQSKHKGQIIFSRVWSMPSADTFDCPPIMGFVHKYLLASKESVDPFARNKRLATWTNDINPATAAQWHLDARQFLVQLESNRGRFADLVILDPPYSQVQVSRSYQDAGKEYKPFGDDNNAVLYRETRNLIDKILLPDGIVLSFGWNSAGMGERRGYEILEILLVCHGGAHNDTICMAERRVENHPELWPVPNDVEKLQRSPFFPNIKPISSLGIAAAHEKNKT